MLNQVIAILEWLSFQKKIRNFEVPNTTITNVGEL